jgi:predicted RNA-binding Zn ribbon-like protein
MSTETKTTFDFTSDSLCLDFTNTVEDRPVEKRRDLLTAYRDLVEWGVQAMLLDEEQAQRLLTMAAQDHQAAGEALLRAIRVRETLYRIFFAVAQEEQPSQADMQTLNEVLSEAMAHLRIEMSDEEFVWQWNGLDRQLDSVLWPVLRAAGELLTSEQHAFVRVCLADDCQWLFLDASKNHTRRWCSMKGCGNRAKARRFTERKRQQPAS